MAFAKVGNDTLEKGAEGFSKVFMDQKLADLHKKNEEHLAAVLKIATEAKVTEITLPKAKATAEKLSQMRDLYVKDEWDNPTELCEWFGFFEGAAVVHWTLVKGVAEAIGSEELEKLADDAIIHHEELLKGSSLILFNAGKERAKEE